MNEIFTNTILQDKFLNFCKEENSLENILFIIDINSFKDTAPDKLLKKYLEIIEKYFFIESKYHLNISQNLSSKVTKNDIIKKDIFDDIFKEIYQMLNNDTYYRFIKSKEYIEMTTIKNINKINSFHILPVNDTNTLKKTKSLILLKNKKKIN